MKVLTVVMLLALVATEETLTSNNGTETGLISAINRLSLAITDLLNSERSSDNIITECTTLKKQVKVLEKRLDEYEEERKQLLTYVGAIIETQTRLMELERGKDSIQLSMQEMKLKLEKTTNDLTANSDNDRDVLRELQNNTININSLQRNVQQVNSDVQSMQLGMNDMHSNINVLETEIQELQNYTKEVDITIGEMKLATREIRTDMTTISKTVDVTDKLSLYNISSLSLKVGRIKDRTETLEEDIRTLNGIVMENDTSGNQREHGAATYVRWGRTICPGNGSDLMHSGYAAGDWWEPGKGSAANFLCLPKTPDWYENGDASETNNGITGAKVYGIEYGHSYGEAIQKQHGDYEVPCALCQSTARISVLMIPGKTQCFPGWHLEYRGYLMCGRPTHSPSEYVCVDAHLETIGSRKDQNGQIFHAVKAGCGSLKCPPYVKNRELTCVVCTR